MKRTVHITILSLLLIVPLFISASNEFKKGKYTKTKSINKEFSVNKSALLKIRNSYGNIDIVTSNTSKIEFEVVITATGNNEDKVLERLEDTDVEFSSASDLVSAKTIFNKKSSNSWWDWGNSKNVKMKINYLVKIPISNNININNDYGNINVDKLEGNAEINCDYGKITTKELMGKNNSLNFDYTKGCYFEYINGGKINADYSDFTISKTKNIYINADYTNTKVETAEDIEYNCDYGNVTIENANNVTGNGDYLTTVIGNVYKSVNLKADYGSIKIKNMTANAENVTIKSDYVGIKIGFDPGYSFNFNIELDYCSLRDHDDLVFNSKIEDSSDKKYIGYYNKEATTNLISIKSDYGSVSLFKN